MEKVDIKVAKCKAKEFFVKALSPEELFAFQERIGTVDEQKDKMLLNNILIQACLVDSDGNNIFKPQQVHLIKDRIGGIDYSCVLAEATGLNDFEKLTKITEKYSKN